MKDERRHEDEHGDDPGEWEEEVERRPGRVASVVFSTRFGRAEIAAIRQAAARVGERTSGFIRVAALNRVRGEVGISVELVPSTSAPPGGAILFAKVGPNTEVATPAEYIPAETV